MSVSQLIYVSRATVYVDRKELQDIAAGSAERNAKRGVTGALLFCDGYFLQILEGEGHVLTSLLEKIRLDPRHSDVHVVGEFGGAERIFPDWTMASLHEAAMSKEQLERVVRWTSLVSPSAVNPDLGRDARQLLAELRAAIAGESLGSKAAAARPRAA